MNKFLFATHNLGKLNEAKNFFKLLNIEVISAKDLHLEAPEETGTTFIENALLKAKYSAKKTGLPVLSEDSGLMINALGGRPGVHSARFAECNGKFSSQANIDRVLHLLKDKPLNLRKAQYYCVMVWLQHAEDPCPKIFEGLWQGEILLYPQGSNGFGYDSIFYVPEHECSAVRAYPKKFTKPSRTSIS